jgi:hypothetical protein
MSIIDKIFNRKANPDIQELRIINNPNPVVLYVDTLLYEMIKHDNLVKEFNADNMPEIDIKIVDQPSLDNYKADYKHVVNRIKIMAGLNPYLYSEETSGKILLKVRGAPYTGHVTIAPNDESVKIILEKDA